MEVGKERDDYVEETTKTTETIPVPETLRGAHPLVSQTLHAMERGERDQDGILRKPKQCLDVHVSKGSLHRALCIMDGLLKTLGARGYQVRITDSEPSETVVELMDVAIPFRVSESLTSRLDEKGPDDSLNGRYEFRHSAFRSTSVPSGALALRIEHGHPYYWKEEQGLRRTWADGKRQRLENCLAKFLDGIVKAATAKREGKLREEEENRQRTEARRRQEENERLRAAMWEKVQAEQARVDRLLAEAVNWQRSAVLRDYIGAVRHAAMARGECVDEQSELGKWLKWADEQAERLDPLRPSPPSILDDQEKYQPPPKDTGHRWV